MLKIMYTIWRMMKSKKKQQAVTKNKKVKKKLVTMEKQDKIDRSKSTFFMLVFVFIFIFLFIVAILWTLRIEVTHSFDGKDLEAYAKDIYTKKTTLKSERGNIYDENGEALAVNIKTYDIYIVLNTGEKDGELSKVDRDKTADILIDKLKLNDDEDAKKLIISQLSQDAKDGYAQVAIGVYGKGISIADKEAIEKAQKKANINAIQFTENVERFYPFGDFASYILGFTMKDENGEDKSQIGVESSLNGYLKGRDGSETSQNDINNIQINKEQSSVMDKMDGSDVTLTIDSQIQQYIQTFMNKYLVNAGEEMAFTVVMDAKDGSILGAYSTPSFDPNQRDVQNYINPYTDFCYEPGSTIKSFVIAAAMDDGVWNPNEYGPTGKREKDEWGAGNYVADWLYNQYGQNWGSITWEQGFWYSSNTIMTQIVDKIGYSKWYDYLTKTFEFGQPIDNQFLKSNPCSVDPQYPLDYANTSFGQGMTVNVLQLLRGYSIFATDGEMLQPHVVEKMTDSETGEVFYKDTEDKSLEPKKKLDEEIAKQVREELEQAVYYESPKGGIYDAVGLPYKNKKVKIGAKTGTAQVASSSGGYAKDGDLIHSVMALAPIDDPEIIVYTAVVAPDDSPVDMMAKYVNNIINYSLDYLNSANSDVDLSKTDNNRYQLKNYVGKDSAEAQKELKKDGIKVITLGTGKIASQYPEKAQVISKDETVILRSVGEVDPQILENKSYSEVDGICSAMNWECELNGIGTSNKVEKINNKKFKIDFTVPDAVKIQKKEQDEKNSDKSS